MESGARLVSDLSSSIAPTGTGVGKGRYRRVLLTLAIGFTLAAWVAVGGLILLFEPSLVQKATVIAVAAIATEIAMWICAALLGVSVYAKIGDWFRGRKTSL
jgi:membrane glycosyltransferase